MIKLDLRIFMTLFLFHIRPKLQFKQGVNVIDAHSDSNWIYGLKCDCWFIFVLYTAISIYVVGSKLQGYGTRQKGGMGRLELILGFRGCRLGALIRQRKLK